MHHNAEFYSVVNSELKSILDAPVPELLMKENRNLISFLKDKIREKESDIHRKYGKIGEQICLNYFIKKQGNYIIKSFNDGTEYNHKLEYKNKIITIKVETDFLTSETGNVAFELRCKNKNSGIYKTESDYFVVVIPGMKNEILIFNRIKLLNYIKQSELDNKYHIHRREDKDNPTDCMLIKYQEIIEDWKLGDILLKKDRV